MKAVVADLASPGMDLPFPGVVVLIGLYGALAIVERSTLVMRARRHVWWLGES
jgi:hypothetical protein